MTSFSDIIAWLRDDWWHKLMALFLAWLIWYTVNDQLQEQETIREVPVQLRVADGIAVRDPGNVPAPTLKLRGSQRRLQLLNRRNIEITARVGADAQPGRYTVQLSSSNVKLPRGISVTDIQPTEFTVTVDEKITVEKPVRVVFTGQMPPELERKRLLVVPRTIGVTGPATDVNLIDEVPTQPVQLDENMPRHSFDKTVALSPLPNLTFTPAEVKVHVEFMVVRESRQFEQVPVRVILPTQGGLRVTGIEPERLQSIIIEAPKAELDGLNPASLRAFVDVSDITRPGGYSLDVHVWVPVAEYELVDVRPSKVTVTLE